MRLLAPLLLGSLLLVNAAEAAAPAGAPAATAQPAIEQKCQRLVETWRERFAAEGITTLIAAPFVIAGDGDRARLETYRAQTIQASVDALQRKFFGAKPNEPVLILLFESEQPYRRLAKKWFDDTDVSHFGYFRRRDRVMLMNIATGGGTLVHELVHALIEPDFPDVPDWFNEGLGSLFEGCTLADNDIRGLTNWRLPALQKAIRAEKLPPLRALIENRRFYDEQHVGLNYAQARYLLMYLQEQGKLVDYYRQFRAARAEDATGLKTLGSVIAPQSLEQLERDWRGWVLTLR
jgi:hypothetical protein